MRKLSDSTFDRISKLILPLAVHVLKMVDNGYSRERIHQLVDVALDEYENPTEE